MPWSICSSPISEPGRNPAGCDSNRVDGAGAVTLPGRLHLPRCGPHRGARQRVVIGDRGRIGAHVFVHGPAVLGARVSLNPRVSIDGGSAVCRRDVRIATGAVLFARSRDRAGSDRPGAAGPIPGIRIGDDVWIGGTLCDGRRSHRRPCGGRDGSRRDAGCSGLIVGVPARLLGDRRPCRARSRSS